MKNFFRENWIVVIIGIALMCSMSMAIRNHYIIKENIVLQKQSERVKKLTEMILSSTVHGLDLGSRGFGLTKNPGMLIPFDKSLKETPPLFNTLDSLLDIQSYPEREKLQEVESEIHHYIQFNQQLVALAKLDSMKNFIALINEDKGYEVWKKYVEFSQPLFAFEEDINKVAVANFNTAMQSNLLLQVSIMILALPALFMFVKRVQSERESRQSLLKEVEENDKRYVFNSGINRVLTAKEINDISIGNSRKASYFIRSLASGKYEMDWEGLNENNRALNKETLAGNLIELREHLQKVKKEDERRNSINEGLAQFSEVVRNHQYNPDLLADKCLSFLVHKVGAQQASLFILVGENDDAHLRLSSCYAYNKKKFVEKRIELGNGLVGQAFLEGDLVHLKQIPQGYTTITSGLGEATPSHLVIIPIKNDMKIAGIIEIATLTEFQDYQIDFLKRAGEFLASAVLSTQTTQKMKQLLEEAMVNEEKMKSNEEEMRQNMEELMATQEELVRKEKETQRQMSLS